MLYILDRGERPKRVYLELGRALRAPHRWQVMNTTSEMTVTAGGDRPLGLRKPRRSRVAHFLCQPPNYGRPDLPSPRPHASLKHSPGSSLFPIAELSSTSLPQVRLARLMRSPPIMHLAFLD